MPGNSTSYRNDGLHCQLGHAHDVTSTTATSIHTIVHITTQREGAREVKFSEGTEGVANEVSTPIEHARLEIVESGLRCVSFIRTERSQTPCIDHANEHLCTISRWD
jgi:hypothetical protein